MNHRFSSLLPKQDDWCVARRPEQQSGLTLTEFLSFCNGTLEGLGILVEPIQVGLRTGDDG
jgi:hypothetical protein